MNTHANNHKQKSNNNKQKSLAGPPAQDWMGRSTTMKPGMQGTQKCWPSSQQHTDRGGVQARLELGGIGHTVG